MYGFDRIKQPEDVVRMPDGSPACTRNHASRYGSWSRPKELAAAVLAYFDGDNAKGQNAVFFVCKRHAGIVKGGITKGSWGMRGVHAVTDFGFDLGNAVADPQKVITSIEAAIKAQKAAAEQAATDRDLAYRRENWNEKRDAYLLNHDVEFGVFGEPDEFGRVFVNLTIGSAEGYRSKVHVSLTPGQVRKIVEYAGLWADNAEKLTLAVPKP